MTRRAVFLFLCFCGVLTADGKKVVAPQGASRTGSPLSPAIEFDGFVYVSGMVGRDAAGKYAPGDVRAQTRQTLRNIGDALNAAGIDFKNVVSTTVWIADLRLLPAADEVYREFFPKDFPARSDFEAQLMAPEAMIEINAVAVKDASLRQIVQPAGARAPARPVSDAVRAGDTLFLSALHPVDSATGNILGESIQPQTEQVMRNQEALLKFAGMSFSDLVSSRIFLAHPSDYEGLNESYRKFVSAVPPSRATVTTHPVGIGERLQVQSIAVKGSGEGRPSGEGITSPIHSYSVKAGRRLFITGMTGRAPDGALAKNDIKAQTRQALMTIAKELSRHEMTFADVLDSTVWLRDARDFSAMNEVYREVVKPDPPARATVRMAPLSPDALIEIMMIAGK